MRESDYFVVVVEAGRRELGVYSGREFGVGNSSGATCGGKRVHVSVFARKWRRVLFMRRWQAHPEWPAIWPYRGRDCGDQKKLVGQERPLAVVHASVRQGGLNCGSGQTRRKKQEGTARGEEGIKMYIYARGRRRGQWAHCGRWRSMWGFVTLMRPGNDEAGRSVAGGRGIWRRCGWFQHLGGDILSMNREIRGQGAKTKGQRGEEKTLQLVEWRIL
ncbi:hypothetical protein F5X68DRAFT_21525 [Plectosphaerella plurivora]|uniref:Uncharacterized protein n=1 Tax=Plectosphaerella plurivora TaxID=936078 RepID=A0A9P9A8W8_9PEZI|nr:hypothetical protein F5X68DRAFT_21525 [Plectosphaerella plurivora]